MSDLSAEVRVERADLPLPCRLELYLVGDGGEDNAVWAGSASLLAMPETGPSYTSVPLRRALGGGGVRVQESRSLVDRLRRGLRVAIRTVRIPPCLPPIRLPCP